MCILKVFYVILNSTIDNQCLMEKMQIMIKIYRLIFGHINKKQYLCTRFAPEVSEPLEW